VKIKNEVNVRKSLQVRQAFDIFLIYFNGSFRSFGKFRLNGGLLFGLERGMNDADGV
jgi:hypothetical protein